jgi:hypothetical protein
LPILSGTGTTLDIGEIDNRRRKKSQAGKYDAGAQLAQADSAEPRKERDEKTFVDISPFIR